MAENILHDYFEELPGGVLIVPGSGGVFEVTMGDRQLFSKEATGRFPEENEVEHQLGHILGAI